MTGWKGRKMLVCPKCNIAYEEGKKFCRKCGSFLLSEEGSTFELPIMESTELQKTEENLFCPKCQEFYRKGKYCRKCGSLLVQEIPSQEHDAPFFEKKDLRKLGKEWVKLSHPSPLITTSVVILLAIMGGYFLWQKHDQTSQPMTPPSQNPASVIETKEAEKIKSLFETIKQANLKKNIDLFMSCYSLDFKDRKRKRLDTLENWKTFHYLDLTYHLKEQTVSGDTANVRVEWLMKISQKGTGKPEDNRTVLDVVLKREGDHWKIKEIQPIS
jgi:RNA polymerase subunit RPABC4/transcription elongation factor Spt4